MAQCLSCNGWGWVFRINGNPPLKREDREKTLRLLMNDHRAVAIKKQICTPCGGYGQRPDPNR